MKKLQLLTATAVVLLTLAGPSLAAQRSQQALDAYASGAETTDRSGAYYFGPRDAQGRTAAPAFQSVQQPEYNRGQSLPYLDRPYGAPDTW